MTGRRAGLVIALANAAFILVATLTPVSHPLPPHFASHCYFCGDDGAVDVLLNLLLFMPLGFGIGLARRRWWVALAVCGGLTCFVEGMQLLVVSGRDASVSDLVNNTSGGMIGFALAACWRSLVLPGPRRALVLAIAAALAWTAMTVGTAVAMEPAAWGVAAVRLRSEGDAFAYYRGAVVGGTFGGVRIRATGPDSLYQPPPGLPIVLESRAQLRAEAVVTAGRETEAMAAIGGVFRGRRTLFLLGQDRRQLVFELRLRAADVLLRYPTVRVADYFPAERGTPGAAYTDEPVRLWGEMVGDSLRVGGAPAGAGGRAAEARERTLVLSPFLGWWTILFFTLSGGSATVALMTAAWVAAWLAPCGYWSARAWSATAAAAFVPPSAVLAGVLGVPLLMHRTPAAWWVWAGAAAGVLAGVLLARLAPRVLTATVPGEAATSRRDGGGTVAAPAV